MDKIGKLLRESGFMFKKRLGQNFITDMSLLRSIAELAGVEKDDTVLEIGCGAGTLTLALAERAGRVIAYDVDASLRELLDITLAETDNVEVVYADFLRVDLSELEKRIGEYKVVANLPYYITTPLIMRFFEQAEKCRSLTVTVQEEVAQRLCAKAGTPEYGSITAVIALSADAEIVKKLPPRCFFPPPEVNSAVVKLTMREGRIAVKSREMYGRCVRAAFLARRKTLANNLMSVFGIPRSTAEELVISCGANVMARGETFTPEQFAALADKMCDILK